ncbi:MAG: hypothetical protein IKN54_09685 [Lachnospiraceae bacterium]|nr:hypothetical protein [Lachnospiraceae bacterium]
MKKKQIKMLDNNYTCGKNNLRSKVAALTMVAVISGTLSMTGCGINADKTKEETTFPYTSTTVEVKDDNAQITAMVVGGVSIYLDEFYYYAYTTQATYEVYYLTENEPLDWSRTVTGDITLEEAAKNKVYEDICKRQAMLYIGANPEKGVSYNITPTDDMMKKVDEMVQEYEQGTNDKLKDRIGISTSRLKEVYLKDILSKDIMEQMKEQGKDPEKEYQKWREENEINTLEWFDKFTFRDTIFKSLEDNIG